MNKYAFELKDVSYEYGGGRNALDAVSFSVREGESLCILGTNGSGKSTLLYIMQGLLSPKLGKSGALRVMGRDVGEGGFADTLKARIGLLFQNPHAQLFCLTVWEELLFGPLQQGLGLREAEKRAGDVLEMLGVGHLKDRSPWQLSGGEMKKVALGTCLSTNPDIYLLDEPTGGLDPRGQVELVELIMTLIKAGKTVITATHDLHIIEDISERALVLGEEHGVIAEDAPSAILKNNDLLLRANLIHEHAHRHGGFVHEHSHAGVHEHGHYEHTHDHSHGERAHHERRATEMDEKLKILIEHWREHNDEHVRTYLEWADRAEAAGSPELALTLREIASQSGRLTGLFQKALKAFEKGVG